MKIRYLLVLFSIALHAQPMPSNFPLMADRQYAVDLKSILTQFSGFTNTNVLKSYETFMIMVKHFLDLGFRIRVREQMMTSEQRALLRTPMQNYNNCRTSLNTAFNVPFNHPSYLGPELNACDKNYAVDAQKIYNGLIQSTDSGTLQEYQNFMIMLKHYEDLRYRITAFEKITPLTTIAKLRGPSKRYENGIDALIRVSAR